MDSPRVLAIDWMRGLVMILMTLDHASEVYNGGRLFTDAIWLYQPGAPLPGAQFLLRWVTHLCAPTFVFLAGASLALSVERQRAAGVPGRTIDRFLVTRGLLIAALDPLWMSWVLTPGRVLLQVLYAIGASMALMAPLRRLGPRGLLALGLALAVGSEALVGLALWAAGPGPGIVPGPVATFLVSGGFLGPVIVGYPVLPWLAAMCLGYSFGHALGRGALSARGTALLGAVALGAFLLVRGLNGYGNMLLPRYGASLVQWLHVSKYPPSLSFLLLELGLMALCLGAFLALQERGAAPRWTSALKLLGQTAFFYYLLHLHLLELSGYLLHMKRRYAIGASLLGTAAAVLLLLPLCRWYRGYKGAHPDGWARYI